MRKYYLYQLIDPKLNIPKYIGITNNLQNRLNKHLLDRSITNKTKWIKSLTDEGLRPIIEEIFSTENVKEIIKLEIEYIEKYSKLYPLTNSTSGGEYYAVGTPIKVFDLEGNYLDSYNSMIEYTEIFNLPKNAVSGISAVCLRKRNFAYGHIFRYLEDCVTKEDLNKLNNSFNKRNPKHFYIFDLEKNLLGEFNSLQEAEREGFGNYECISQCLRNIEGYNSVKGNIPCFNIEEFETRKEKYIKGLSKGKLSNVISKYSLDGDFLNIYYTYSDAAKSCNLKNISGIKKCCELKYKQAGGFQWRFGYNTSNIGKCNKSKHVQYIGVNQYDLQGNFIKSWNNCSEAAEELNLKRSNINIAASKEKSSGGYIWKYIKAV